MLYVESTALLTACDVPHVLDSQALQGPGMRVLILAGWFSSFCWGRGKISLGKTSKQTKEQTGKEGWLWARSTLQVSVPFSGSSLQRRWGNPCQKKGEHLLQLPGPGMLWMGMLCYVFLQAGWNNAWCRFDLFLCYWANPGPQYGVI